MADNPAPGDLYDALAGLLDAYQPKTRAWPAYLGDGNNTVIVAGRTNYVFCRMPDGNVLEVYNNRVTPAYGLPVIVGYDPLNPTLLQVLTFRYVYVDPASQQVANLHATTHQYPEGRDLLWVHVRQWTPLRVGPYSGMTVQVYQTTIWTTTGWSTTNEFIDLTSYIPGVAGQARYVLIYTDDTGLAQVRSGTAVASRSALTLANIPAMLTGERPLAGVILENGMTAVLDNSTRQDIVDLRFSWPRVDTLAVEEDAFLWALIGW